MCLSPATGKIETKIEISALVQETQQSQESINAGQYDTAALE